MEDKENSAPEVPVKVDEAPESYRIAPRTENPTELAGSFTLAAPATATAASPVSVAVSSTGMKKKRGRPRKYGPDGTVATALSPMPISSSIPLSGEFSAWKRGRGRPIESIKKSYKYEYESSGERIAYSVGANFTPHVITVNAGEDIGNAIKILKIMTLGFRIAYSVGANFTPHVITVNAGEDVTMKVMSFSQQGSRAICILSANGTISNVTLRQPTSSGGTLTYEGRFEILSLSGSFMPTENGGTRSRSGGMSVSLAGPDGRVVGGGLAGLLVAAGPVQVVVGSFLPGHQQEAKPKKQRIEPTTTITLTPANPLCGEETKVVYGGESPILTSTAFHGDNSASLNQNRFRNLAADIKTTIPEEESKGPSQSNCEVSC